MYIVTSVTSHNVHVTLVTMYMMQFLSVVVVRGDLQFKAMGRVYKVTWNGCLCLQKVGGHESLLEVWEAERDSPLSWTQGCLHKLWQSQPIELLHSLPLDAT